MKVADYIARFLDQKGIRYVYELSGGMITHLLDSLHQTTSIRIVTMHHEQGAAFAVDGNSRVTGIPAVALATSGPGATNLLTGIGSCYFDSVPGLFITGQVNRHEQKGDRGIRQLGFQETEIVPMASHLTKKSYQIKDPSEVPVVLEEAYQLSISGRPGPVLIDIPMDVQRAILDPEAIHSGTLLSEKEIFPKSAFSYVSATGAMVTDIQKSNKPLLLVGRGVAASLSTELLQRFLALTKLPVVTSLLGIDTVAYNHPQRVGFIGSYGNRWANIAFGESDLLIVIGSRLDIRQTGADTKYFENRPIYHVDCEEGEINNRVQGCTPIVADVKDFFTHFIEKYENTLFEEKRDWMDYINDLRAKWPDTKELKTNNAINPNEFMHALSARSLEVKVFLADVGAHQMWAAQSLEIKEGQKFLTSAGMGAMGYALPAAIGASLATDKANVVAIIGDGCMQLNIQELQTIVRNGIPVKIIVMNNENLGMIRQFQDSYFNSRYQSTWWGYSAPDFEKIAGAYGIAGKTIRQSEEVTEAIEWLWNEENANNPVLLQVMIDPRTNTYPKIAFGKPITEMEPFAKPVDMEGT